jgi:hypothetical protein
LNSVSVVVGLVCPEVSKKLGAGNTWTVEAEKALFEAFMEESA